MSPPPDEVRSSALSLLVARCSSALSWSGLVSLDGPNPPSIGDLLRDGGRRSLGIGLAAKGSRYVSGLAKPRVSSYIRAGAGATLAWKNAEESPHRRDKRWRRVPVLDG